MQPETPSVIRLPVPSPWGIFLLQVSREGLYSLSFPDDEPGFAPDPPRTPFAFAKNAARELENFFYARPFDLSGFPVDYSGLTSFQIKVLGILHRTPAGFLTSYGELAASAGCPGGARAVGGVMKSNRLPVIIPCHRVLAFGGKPGGYSKGLVWKDRFLACEKAAGPRAFRSSQAKLEVI